SAAGATDSKAPASTQPEVPSGYKSPPAQQLGQTFPFTAYVALSDRRETLYASASAKSRNERAHKDLRRAISGIRTGNNGAFCTAAAHGHRFVRGGSFAALAEGPYRAANSI